MYNTNTSMIPRLRILQVTSSIGQKLIIYEMKIIMATSWVNKCLQSKNHQTLSNLRIKNNGFHEDWSGLSICIGMTSVCRQPKVNEGGIILCTLCSATQWQAEHLLLISIDLLPDHILLPFCSSSGTYLEFTEWVKCPRLY
jgi:hypothetical protein